MKEKLEKLMKEYKSKSKELIEAAENNSIKKIWSQGIGDAFSVEPYRVELLGIKPSRILKKTGEPGKNKHCYDFDKEGRIIHSKFYSEYNDLRNNWITTNNIYVYEENGVYRYNFQSVIDNVSTTGLARVVFIEIKENKPIKTYELNNNEEYIEKEYIYEGDKIIEINTNWLSGSLMGYSRKFKLYYENDNVRITSISKNGEKQIYPEK